MFSYIDVLCSVFYIPQFRSSRLTAFQCAKDGLFCLRLGGGEEVVFAQSRGGWCVRNFIKHNFLGDERGGDALAFYFYNMLNLTSTNITFADNRAEQKNAQLLNCNFVRNSGAINSGTFQLSVSEPFFVISTYSK